MYQVVENNNFILQTFDDYSKANALVVELSKANGNNVYEVRKTYPDLK